MSDKIAFSSQFLGEKKRKKKEKVRMEGPDEDLKRKWSAQVEEMRSKVVLEDLFDEVRYIAGMDISFVKDHPTKACSGLVVLSFPDLNVVYEDFRMVELTVPYIPGFLAFREVDFLLELLDSLKVKRPDVFPQVIFVDGNGTHHPQRFGIACHLGVARNVATVGIAKTFLVVDGLDAHAVKERFMEECSKKGSWIPLKGPDGDGSVFGAAVATAEDLHNPIFVSPGNRISLETAVRLTLECSRFRQPEPIRHADHRSREVIAKLQKEEKGK